MNNNELLHWGIKGQKWGVRRYQNPDGTLTKEGKKRYYKELKKSYDKQKDSSRPYLINDSTKEIIKNKIGKSKILESDDVKEAIKESEMLENKWKKLQSKAVDFYETKAADDVFNRAYDDAYKWYEQNDPTYLNEIIKKNNGKKTDLDDFSDFGKTRDGYVDIELDKAEKEWLKSPEGQASKLADDAWNDYFNKTKEVGQKVSESLLGEYGNKKLSALGSETYSDLVSNSFIDLYYIDQVFN